MRDHSCLSAFFPDTKHRVFRYAASGLGSTATSAHGCPRQDLVFYSLLGGDTASPYTQKIIELHTTNSCTTHQTRENKPAHRRSQQQQQQQLRSVLANSGVDIALRLTGTAREPCCNSTPQRGSCFQQDLAHHEGTEGAHQRTGTVKKERITSRHSRTLPEVRTTHNPTPGPIVQNVSTKLQSGAREMPHHGRIHGEKCMEVGPRSPRFIAPLTRFPWVSRIESSILFQEAHKCPRIPDKNVVSS